MVVGEGEYGVYLLHLFDCNGGFCFFAFYLSLQLYQFASYILSLLLDTYTPRIVMSS